MHHDAQKFMTTGLPLKSDRDTFLPSRSVSPNRGAGYGSGSGGAVIFVFMHDIAVRAIAKSVTGIFVRIIVALCPGFTGMPDR